MSINTNTEQIMQQNKSETQVKKGFFSSIFDMLFTPVIKPLEINKPSNDVRVDIAIKEIKQWQHSQNNEQTTSNFESSPVVTQRTAIESQDTELINTKMMNQAGKLINHQPSSIVEPEIKSGGYRSSNPFPSKTPVVSDDKAIQPSESIIAAVNKSKERWQQKVESGELDKLFAVSDKSGPVLNLADDQLAKAKLTACATENNNEENAMQNIDTTKLNEDEIMKYANERIEQSPLKSVLGGIKFPSKVKKPANKLADHSDKEA